MLPTQSGLQKGMKYYLITFFLIFSAIRVIKFFIVNVSPSTALARRSFTRLGRYTRLRR